MPLYEHVFLTRQDASTQQVEDLTSQFTGIIEQMGGKIAKTEQWGVKSLSYRLREDVLRYLSIRVREHEEGPSAMMRKVERDRERDERGFGFRDRDRGSFRDRDRGEYRRDREGGRTAREGYSEDAVPGVTTQE